MTCPHARSSTGSAIATTPRYPRSSGRRGSTRRYPPTVESATVTANDSSTRFHSSLILPRSARCTITVDGRIVVVVLPLLVGRPLASSRSSVRETALFAKPGTHTDGTPSMDSSARRVDPLSFCPLLSNRRLPPVPLTVMLIERSAVVGPSRTARILSCSSRSNQNCAGSSNVFVTMKPRIEFARNVSNSSSVACAVYPVLVLARFVPCTTSTRNTLTCVSAASFPVSDPMSCGYPITRAVFGSMPTGPSFAATHTCSHGTVKTSPPSSSSCEIDGPGVTRPRQRGVATPSRTTHRTQRRREIPGNADHTTGRNPRLSSVW